MRFYVCGGAEFFFFLGDLINLTPTTTTPQI